VTGWQLLQALQEGSSPFAAVGSSSWTFRHSHQQNECGEWRTLASLWDIGLKSTLRKLAFNSFDCVNNYATISQVLALMNDLPEIRACHHVTGSSSL